MALSPSFSSGVVTVTAVQKGIPGGAELINAVYVYNRLNEYQQTVSRMAWNVHEHELHYTDGLLYGLAPRWPHGLTYAPGAAIARGDEGDISPNIPTGGTTCFMSPPQKKTH